MESRQPTQQVDLIDYLREIAAGSLIVMMGILVLGVGVVMLNYGVYSLFGTTGLNVFVVVQIIIAISSLVWWAMMKMLDKVSNVVTNAFTIAIQGMVKFQANDDMGEMGRMAAMARIIPTVISADKQLSHDSHTQALRIATTAQQLAKSQSGKNDQDFIDIMTKAFEGKSMENVE